MLCRIGIAFLFVLLVIICVPWISGRIWYVILVSLIAAILFIASIICSNNADELDIKCKNRRYIRQFKSRVWDDQVGRNSKYIK